MFHKTLLTSFNLVDNLLFQDYKLKESLLIEDFSQAENEGYLSFEMYSENSVDYDIYAKVIYSINELIKCTTELIAAIEKKDFEELPKTYFIGFRQ